MPRPTVRREFSEGARIRLFRLVATSFLLLGIALPARALAQTPAPPAPRDDSKRVVPTRIHDRAQAEGEVRVLVELALPSNRRTESTLSAQARFAYRQEIADTAARVLARLARHPHQVFRRFQTTPLIAIGASPGALRELEASGVMVRRVIEDRIHRPVLMDSVPLIGADQAWAQGYDGTGTVVAVIDSGVDSAHPLLAGKVIEEACYSTTSGSQSTTLCPNGAQEQIGPGAAAPCPLEEQGCWHGTHVAGIVAGNGTPADLPIWGVGKGANLIAIQVFSQINRFLDCGGQPPCLGAYTSDILAALERVYTLRTAYPIAAVNMSLGAELFSATCDDQEYKPFIDNLRSVGIATVVASGNDGSTSQISAPACVSTAVSVGATTKEDQVADFSNVAPFLSLFAPGDEIISAYPGGQFAVASGTSMASPHVAGAWAILKQAKPGATVDEVLQALTDTGVLITDTRAGGVTTKPRIQVDLALLALLYPGVPLVGSVTPDRGTVGTSLSVTITGINFESGTTASFGDGVTVTSMTLVSAHELTIGLTIPLTTAIGARDVTLTNPGGQTYTRPNAFTVLPPPPTMSLAFLGKLRDKVGPSPTAFAPDTALDGTFRVIVQGGMWPRTVTRLDLRRASGAGIWDTDPATPYWALGATASLDSALLNAAGGTVSFPVADGGAFFMFASDLTPTPFTTGSTFTLTASFLDGTSASTSLNLPILPAISSVAPNTAAPGASLTASVTGTNFQSGATASFGADVTVNSTTFVSSTQLSVALTIGTAAALGARDVTVVNGDGQVVIKSGGFTIVPPPPAITLAFLGKSRDKVGPTPTAFAPDGALDGTFRVTVQGGIWSRTVTKLDLRQTSGGGIWDTDPATSYWALGTTTSLDGALVNAGNGTVSLPVADGGAFFVFASDLSPTPFSSGAGFTLTANFADGTSATTTVTLPQMPSITAVSPNTGAPGASLTVTVTGTNFQSGASASFGAGIMVNSMTFVSSTQLSVAIAIDSAATIGARDVTVTTGGQTGTRVAGFTVSPPAPTLGLAFLGKLRDKVGANPTTYSADGALDGTFRMTLQSGSGARTLTRLELRRNGGGGTWDTDAATSFWALGVAAGLDSALLNAGNGAVSAAIADGGTVHVFAGDPNPPAFTSGSGFTVTANFADGTSATTTVTLPPMPAISSVTPSTGSPGAAFAVTVAGSGFQPGASASFGADVTVTSTTVTSSTQLSVAISIGATATMGPRDVTVTNPDGQVAIKQGGFAVAPPAPTLSLTFLGKLRDKVGANPTTYSADGALDGTFRMTLQSGSGARTLTRLELRRNGGGGTWDTDAATSFWALGVAAGLDSALLNAGNGAVSAAIADGGAVHVFAGDPNPPAFTSGSGFTVTANFADGTSATASVTLPPVPTISSLTPSNGAQGASLAVTVTGTNFQPGATASFGAGVTVTSTTVVASTQVSVALSIAAPAATGPRDVTVTNPDGQTAIRTGGFTVMPPPPTLSLAFQGKLRDKVGANPTAFSPDGALDGTFRVTVEAGSGPRTVTRLELRRNGGAGIWDTDPATSYWALGAAAGLDSALLNNGSGVVNFAVADGGAFYIFSADFNPSPYTSGTSFSLTGTFADGSVVTVTTTVP
jgi:subtilisin family serine protease